MKEKIETYKWLLLAICIVGCDVGWNVYQNQSLKQGMELKVESSNDTAYGENQEVQIDQGLNAEGDEKTYPIRCKVKKLMR